VTWLVVGLGNPGKQYDKTRHNIGFAAVDLLSEKYRLEFRKSLKLRSSIAEGMIGNEKCLLLKPMTFMNLSGEAVLLTLRYHPVEIAKVLIIVDDVAIPFGKTRMRLEGSPGGHNGLKSIEECLQTNVYARVRLGVGQKTDGIDLSSHVLGRFTPEEEKIVPDLLHRAAETAELFINSGVTRAMDFCNKL
jgi:PTH1 family peptidyl-tRNA hydrolase